MESLLPMMMCREIPWEYEEEMKKVQALEISASLGASGIGLKS